MAKGFNQKHEYSIPPDNKLVTIMTQADSRPVFQALVRASGKPGKVVAGFCSERRLPIMEMRTPGLIPTFSPGTFIIEHSAQLSGHIRFWEKVELLARSYASEKIKVAVTHGDCAASRAVFGALTSSPDDYAASLAREAAKIVGIKHVHIDTYALDHQVDNPHHIALIQSGSDIYEIPDGVYKITRANRRGEIVTAELDALQTAFGGGFQVYNH